MQHFVFDVQWFNVFAFTPPWSKVPLCSYRSNIMKTFVQYYWHCNLVLGLWWWCFHPDGRRCIYAIKMCTAVAFRERFNAIKLTIFIFRSVGAVWARPQHTNPPSRSWYNYRWLECDSWRYSILGLWKLLGWIFRNQWIRLGCHGPKCTLHRRKFPGSNCQGTRNPLWCFNLLHQTHWICDQPECYKRQSEHLSQQCPNL